MGIFNLHGRVAVVTGGTAGLGRGMAIALARQGADLAILARRPDKLTEPGKSRAWGGGASRLCAISRTRPRFRMR